MENKKALTIMIAIFIFSIINLTWVINLLHKNNDLKTQVEAYKEYDYTLEILQKNTELWKSWRNFEEAIVKKREEIKTLNEQLKILEQEKFKIEDEIHKNREIISLWYEVKEVQKEEEEIELWPIEQILQEETVF